MASIPTGAYLAVVWTAELGTVGCAQKATGDACCAASVLPPVGSMGCLQGWLGFIEWLVLVVWSHASNSAGLVLPAGEGTSMLVRGKL